ncbi:helix-turn-helix domain-containing protein [Streptomyces sp. 11x1]|uniref:helix-turn-helix domain-containing protein n=1 Tax=Streptomyces sp. 11x1 TaxID=3038642 RepID=UPI00293050E1|nr:helix-turn-helix domain-containing protein [Streptomyces sp. 11x1]WNZ11484.1 helix-turn-helix domain-containing protein [Streptomyces sp. 11x1]
MTATNPRDKASAVLWLAAGKSQRAAAEAAGVAPGTVGRWRRDPVFAAEVERMRAVWVEKSNDGLALLDHMDEVERRLRPGSPVRVEGGRWHVTVSIPSGASARRVERLTARAIARGMRALREAEGR